MEPTKADTTDTVGVVAEPLPGSRLRGRRQATTYLTLIIAFWASSTLACAWVVLQPESSVVQIPLLVVLVASWIPFMSAFLEARSLVLASTPVVVGAQGVRIPMTWFQRRHAAVPRVVPLSSIREVRLANAWVEPRTNREFSELLVVLDAGRMIRSAPMYKREALRLKAALGLLIPELARGPS